MGKNFTLLSEQVESTLIEKENKRPCDFQWGKDLNSKKLDESSPFKYNWENGYTEQNKRIGLNETIKREKVEKQTFTEKYGII